MNGIRLALLGLALLSGCKNKAAPPAPVEAPAPLETPDDELWRLTLPKLDGYLRYQRTLLVQAGKVQPPPWDGGLKKFEEPTVEQKADLDERARVEAGLTPDDVLKIEAMLSQVSARRMTYKMMRMDEKVPDLPAADPNEPAVGVENTIAEAKAQQEAHAKMKRALMDLPEERAQFGSKNIDVLLQREEELLKNWALMMEVPELSKNRR